MNVKNSNLKAGFTLVELIVSVSITAILMVGLSAFFSSSFRNIFQSSQSTAELNSQFLTSLILQQKLSQSAGMENLQQDSVVLKNGLKMGQFPFTYLGKDKDKIVFKDFFVFNGLNGETSSFSDVDNVKNPSGITQMNSIYYVVAPLENAVYQCESLPGSCESKLPLGGLKHPTDITTDGTNLYLSDSGNDRILKVSEVGSANNVTELATGFNFPTGLAYYPKGTGALFVSDTYHHQVKKIDLVSSGVEVVAGAGENKACNGTAKYCQLSFPTGLVIGDDGQTEALYIADTGTGRILKITDPKPELANHDFPLHLTDEVQVKKIEFTLGQNTLINTIKAGVGDNTLHKGLYSPNGNILTFSLTASTTGNVMMDECQGDPPKCKSYFQGFTVDEKNNIFQENDQITLGGKLFTVAYVNPIPGGATVGVLPDDLIFSPPVPTPVQIESSFTGLHHFFVDLTDVIFTPGFKTISVAASNFKDQPVNDAFADRQILRVGDGTLGTAEDMISVFMEGLTYPTGLGWDNGKLFPSALAEYTTEFSAYDYQSDFEVKDFNLSVKNAGTLMELFFKALLSEDSEGKKYYEPYTLNSVVKE